MKAITYYKSKKMTAPQFCHFFKADSKEDTIDVLKEFLMKKFKYNNEKALESANQLYENKVYGDFSKSKTIYGYRENA